MRTRAFLIALAAIVALDLNSPMAYAAVSLTPIGTYSSGALFDGDKGAAEIRRTTG